MTLGDKLKNVRKERGLTLDEVVERLRVNQKVNVTKGTLSRWENNKTEPTNSTLSAFAKEFSLDMNFLLGISEKDQYYVHKETDDLVEEAFQGLNNEYRILLDTPRKLSKKQMESLIEIIESMIKVNER